jgi:LmbE family N-acetylglucosaminyl deacetylase
MTMLPLRLTDSAGPLKVLAIGSHADDIEIGCGGTLLRLGALEQEVIVHWVVLGCAEDRRAREAEASAIAFLAGTAEVDVRLGRFPDAFLPYAGGDVKRFFEQVKAEFAPQLIFTHYRHDLHQDHRLASELTWNSFRDHAILEYEIPKYDGDFGTPNVFVHLDSATSERKIAHILEHFPSQADKHWFAADLFRSLHRIRGLEAHSPTGLAEAFYGRKLVLL